MSAEDWHPKPNQFTEDPRYLYATATVKRETAQSEIKGPLPANWKQMSEKEKRKFRNSAGHKPPERDSNAPLDPTAEKLNPMGHLILGVDPGIGGALALYNLETKNLEAIWDTPLEHNTRNGWKQVHARKLAELLRPWATEIKVCIVEDVHGRKNDGVTNAFKFGYTYGVTRAVIRMLGIPVVPVLPSIWKPASGLSYDKSISRVKAANLFPHWKWYFTKVKDHDRAEAALLAVFAEKFFKVEELKNG